MLVYFYIIFALYLIFIGLLIYGWGKAGFQTSELHHEGEQYFVTVLVAVRNEEKTIEKLLQSLASQSFPRHKYEVIVVDDYSEDHTRLIIETFIAGNNLPVKLVTSDGDAAGASKKNALKRGLAHSSGDIIITTDGDCRFGRKWLRAMVDGFADESIHFISGPVLIEPGKTYLSKIQHIEFLSLVGSGASLIGLGYPLMCNGANLAFRRRAFYDVQGYDGIDVSASGDDVFLMQKIFSAFPGAVRFVKADYATVFTDPVESLSQFVHQRKRWASKWNSNLLSMGWLIPVFLFIHYLSLFALVLATFFYSDFWTHILFIILIKFAADWFYLQKIERAFKGTLTGWMFLLSEMIYPIYAIFIGFSVHFGRWKWKGRKFKR